MSEAKNKFDELFPYGIAFDGDSSGSAMINRYDTLSDEQISYIEDATFEYHKLTEQKAEMYEMLEDLLNIFDYDEPYAVEIRGLLEKARGES